MPIRWSALKVKEATDKVEEIVNPILEPLNKAREVVREARKIPNLPEYMGQRLARLEGEIERVTGGMGQDFVRDSEGKGSYQEVHRKGYIHRAIESIREELPKNDLAKEQAHLQKWLDLFGGDREKAEVAMNIDRPPKGEVPKEQLAMAQPAFDKHDQAWSQHPMYPAPLEERGEQLPERICDDGTMAVSEVEDIEPELDDDVVEGKELCYECGRSVAQGSGGFVNRVPSFDSEADREDMGVPYPEGGYSCEECDTLASNGEDTVVYYLLLSPEARRERGIPEDFEERCNATESDDSDGDGETDEQRIDRQAMAIDKAYDEGMERKLLEGAQGELLQ